MRDLSSAIKNRDGLERQAFNIGDIPESELEPVTDTAKSMRDDFAKLKAAKKKHADWERQDKLYRAKVISVLSQIRSAQFRSNRIRGRSSEATLHSMDDQGGLSLSNSGA